MAEERANGGRRRWVAAAIAVLLVLTPIAGVALLWTPQGPAPNVLILIADDLGTDKIAAYGEHPRSPSTPRIDGLAAEGVLFRNAYAYPLCSPTRAALLTGRYGRRNGFGMVLRDDSTWELPLPEVTLPEVLKQGRDFATAAVGKWHLAGRETASGYRHPNLQGFDHFAGSIHQLYTEAGERRQPGNYFHYDKDVDGTVTRVHEYATTGTTDDALAAVGTLQEPWLLYVAYSAAHAPFHVPPGSDLPPDASVPAKQAAMVEKMDEEIGRLLDGLPADVRARTVIVFLGDNGTDGKAVLPPRDPEASKGTLSEGGTNVPFIVAGPGVVAPGTVTDALVEVVDLLPTLAELAGVDPSPTGQEIDGVSFASVLADPTSAGLRRFAYTEKFSPAGPPPWRNVWRAIRDDRYKLVTSDSEPPAFYDLQGRDDDGPARSPDALAGEERRRCEALQAELDRIERDAPFEY